MSKVKNAYLTYAAIGPESITKEVKEALAEIGYQMEKLGFILRSDGSLGFSETIVESVEDDSKLELYLPWENYNDFQGKSIINSSSYEAAFLNHPDWKSNCLEERKLHAAISHVVMGKTLKEPSEFLLTCSDKNEPDDFVDQAVRIADSLLIPVFDLGTGIEVALSSLEDYLTKNGNIK